MNALWITRLCAYKNSPLSVESSLRLIAIKISRQNQLLRRYKEEPIFLKQRASNLQEVLLEEARAARQFWGGFGRLIKPEWEFETRTPRAADTVNRLLDIGYHHLTNFVRKTLTRYQVPTDMGFLHVAHETDSAPLAYDLVELFRSDIVDAEVLRFIRLKKKPLFELQQKNIAHFLHEVNKRMDRAYYLRDFKICQTYRYYMELQILKFIKAVNHKTVFEPLDLPSRHENRCRLTAKPDMVLSPQEFIDSIG